ncbi:hypothetical protein, partial [Burkholderia cenocepacia]|uniref:hypothetical protein n=1 Tax=Burkholderia cenocepacia TaxID=95486 RepID=UPI00163A2744
HYSEHRKFDGTLSIINFKFKPKDKNEKKIFRVFDVLGYGAIENFIDQEDIDPNRLVNDGSVSSSESEYTGTDTSTSTCSDD